MYTYADICILINEPHVPHRPHRYVEGESLLMALKNVAVSSGSACTSVRARMRSCLKGVATGFRNCVYEPKLMD